MAIAGGSGSAALAGTVGDRYVRLGSKSDPHPAAHRRRGALRVSRSQCGASPRRERKVENRVKRASCAEY